MVMIRGNSARVAPVGWSARPFVTPTLNWMGGLPPSSVESFSVILVWKTPPPRRRTVFGFICQATPKRGSKTNG